MGSKRNNGIIDKEEKLLRPKNLFELRYEEVFRFIKQRMILKLVFLIYGQCFYEKREDVFETSEKFLKENEMKKV